MASYTEAQRLLLQSFIMNDPVLVTKASGPGTDYAFIADALNANASPGFYVWRGVVSSDDLRAAAMIGGTQLDGLSASKRESLLFAIGGSLDFRLATNRAAIDDFCGSQNTLRAALQAVQKQLCSVAEKVLKASGVGTAASPADAGWLGTIPISEIGEILA